MIIGKDFFGEKKRVRLEPALVIGDGDHAYLQQASTRRQCRKILVTPQ
jgi:hypothetical protein